MGRLKQIALPLALSLGLALQAAGCAPADAPALPLAGKKFAIVVKSEENQYFEVMIRGFCAVIEAQGGTPLVYQPSSATAEEQITIINGLVTENVDCVAVAANSQNAIDPALDKAKEAGIAVLSFDSAVSPASRALHVNQADAGRIARALMAAAADITGGEGQIAILSTTNQANNQNTWIDEMRAMLEAGEYPGLILVDIVYGEDDYAKSYDKTAYLLDSYPHLAAIVVPTAAGMPAAAACVTDRGQEGRVKITGLGMPSQMADYIGPGRVCPYMFLWNPEDVGRMTAYAAIALVEKRITGAQGQVLTAGDMGDYEIQEDAYGGTEIVLQADPIRFDASNIDQWKTEY